jgi:hypothetical protein
MATPYELKELDQTLTTLYLRNEKIYELQGEELDRLSDRLSQIEETMSRKSDQQSWAVATLLMLGAILWKVT